MMKILKPITLILAVVFCLQMNAQVGINSTGAAPDPNAGLDVSFSDKGFLPPRLTTAQRDAMTGTIPLGLTIFNTTTMCFEYYAYNLWQTGNCAVCPLPSSPVESTHTASLNQIVWNWNVSSGAAGYKWNTVDDYDSATDNSSNTNTTQTGLNVNTSYTLYVWAYNDCGHSAAVVLTQTTLDIPCTDSFVDSRDSKSYNVVLIGSQCWMKENLAYLPAVSGPAASSGTDPYQYVYDYNGTNVSAAKATSNYNTYGVLYNWPAAMQGYESSSSVPSGVQGICPTGWHLPSDDEWTILMNYLGGQAVCGGPMKSTTGWNAPNVGATNASGFTGLPTGFRWDETGSFMSIGYSGRYWSSTDIYTTSAWNRYLSYDGGNIDIGTNIKPNGFSVRCVRN